MKPLAHPLVCDENIQSAVVDELRAQGRAVVSVHEVGQAGVSDRELLSWAAREGRVVVTHDSDFGTLAVRGGQAYVGIVVRASWPCRGSFVLELLHAVDALEIAAQPPFLLVAERRGDRVRVRLRNAAAEA